MIPLFFCLTVLALAFAGGSAAQANPTVPQGGSASFPSVGSDKPAGSLTWDIVRQGLTVATSSVPNGWTVAYNTTTSQFTVGAPVRANVAVNYEVRSSSGSGGVCRVEESVRRGRRRFQCAPLQTPAVVSGSGVSAFFDVTSSGIGVSVIGLTLSPASVVGGNPSTGTVTLSGAAPVGGTLVTLASSNTNVATVPANFTIAAGRTGGTFTVSTKAVTTTTAVTITASGGGGSASATLTVNPTTVPTGPVPDVASVSLNPSTVQQDSNGQAPSLATVTLTGPALSGGQVVALAASSTAATVPAWLLVPAGQTSATFTVTTTTITAQTTVDIAAAYAQNTPHSATLTIKPKAATGGPLGLTPTGIARGFGLTTFASNFYNDGLQGPIGMAFGPAGHVYVVDLSSQRFLDFPSDSDGQNAGAVANYPAPPGTADNIVNVDGGFYMNFAYSDSIVQFFVTAAGLQTQPIVTLPVGGGVVDLGMVANPVNGHIFVGNLSAGTIYDVDPIAKTFQVFISGLPGLDGITLSPDGRTLYAVVYLNSNISRNYIVGYDIPSHSLVFTSGLINGADGCAVGRGALQGKLYVNTNFGEVYEVDLVTAVGTVIASGGTRGDYVRPDPNGTLLLTQTDRICRLVPPQGGSFADVSNVAATRDDLTTPNTTPYGSVTLKAPVTSRASSQFGAFDATGLGGSVVFASMQRGGGVAWSGATNFDMQWGLQSLTSGSLATYGPVQTGMQKGTSPYGYATYWDMPADTFGLPATNWNLPSPFYADIQGSLGQLYQVALADHLSAGWGSYTVTDTPEQGWPTLRARNILNFTVYPGNNPDVTQGRALDITLPGADVPLEGDWDILLNGQILASSLNSNGWNVEVDHQTPHGVWITAPANATVAPFYEARFAHNYGSGFFDVVQAVTPPASAPLMLPLTVLPKIVVGGSNATGTVTLDAPAPVGGATVTLDAPAPVGGATVTLDAPAPVGGATVTLICQTYGVTVPASVTVPAGQTGAAYPITTLSTTTIVQAVVFASYNGTRMAVFTVVPTGNGDGPPQGGASLALTATGGPGRVTLNWTAAQRASSYSVKRSTAHGGPYGVIATDIRPTQYVDTRVTNGTTYFYVVTASNVYGESVASNEASATPNASVPVASLRVNPTSVLGGNLAIGTVTLSSAAPMGGAFVTLSSNNSAATVPGSVLVPAGTTSADFVVSTTPVSADTSVTLSATAGSNTSTATLTVLAPSVLSLTLTPNPVVGGGAATGTVTLNGDVPYSSGASVTLSSANTGVATISPASVTFPRGSRSVTFTVNTTAVSSATSVGITATHGSGCNGSATSNLQVNPANITCYIADLTLSPTCIIGTGTSTATVTLSAPAPTGGALVRLKSARASVVVPASITVAAGSQTATFTLNCTGVQENDYITVSGSYNTWTQATVLTMLPTGYLLTPQHVSATPGCNLVVIQWKQLPEKSIQGYNIYRVVNGTPVRLNANPLKDAVYIDSGLANGTNVLYQITVVNLQNQESAPSQSVAATPTNTAPTMQWINPPAAVTDDVNLQAATSNGDIPDISLLADGVNIAQGALANPTVAPGTVSVTLQSEDLSNGSHTLQVFGTSDNGIAYVTPPIQMQVNNPVGQFKCSSTIASFDGSMMKLDGILPPNATSWTVQIIRRSDGSIVRSWQSTTLRTHLAWDGTDAAGADADGNDFWMDLTVSLPNQPPKKRRVPLTKIGAFPLFVGLVDKISSDDYTKDQEVVDSICQAVDQVTDLANKSRYIHLIDTNIDKDSAKTIRDIISTCAVDFYIFGHGAGFPNTPRQVRLHNLRIYAFRPTNGAAKTWVDTHEDTAVIVSEVMRPQSNGGMLTHDYNFVFIDSCFSGGGVMDINSDIAHPDKGDPGEINWDWKNAFGLQDDIFFTCFLGWNGVGRQNAIKSFGTVLKTSFFTWRLKFWERLASGATVTAAFDWAVRHKSVGGPDEVVPEGNINGKPRRVIYADTWLTPN